MCHLLITVGTKLLMALHCAGLRSTIKATISVDDADHCGFFLLLSTMAKSAFAVARFPTMANVRMRTRMLRHHAAAVMMELPLVAIFDG